MFKKKPKRSKGDITNEEVRTIAREEVSASSIEHKKIDDEEKRKALIKRRIEGLPKNQRLRFLRYLKQKEAQHGEK